MQLQKIGMYSHSYSINKDQQIKQKYSNNLCKPGIDTIQINFKSKIINFNELATKAVKNSDFSGIDEFLLTLNQKVHREWEGGRKIVKIVKSHFMEVAKDLDKSEVDKIKILQGKLEKLEYLWTTIRPEYSKLPPNSIDCNFDTRFTSDGLIWTLINYTPETKKAFELLNNANVGGDCRFLSYGDWATDYYQVMKVTPEEKTPILELLINSKNADGAFTFDARDHISINRTIEIMAKILKKYDPKNPEHERIIKEVINSNPRNEFYFENELKNRGYLI